MYKDQYRLKVFLNYCMFLIYLPVSHAGGHGSDIIVICCNARSSFFQFVSGFPSTVKLLPLSQIAQQLKKHEKIKRGQRFSTRFPLRKSGFFPRLKRTTL